MVDWLKKSRYRGRTQGLKLEKFEILGLAASAVAVVIFLAYGQALDKLVGEPGYHWHMLFVVAGIYAKFIPWALLVGGAAVALAARLASQRKTTVWPRFLFALRVFLAYCVLLIVFRVVNFYVPVLHPGLRDHAIQNVDAALFGKQVSDWLEPLVHPWLTHILTGAYVAWFWLLFATILLLVYVSREIATEYVLASLIAFYVGYVCYILIPVVGPGYTLHYAVQVGDIAPHFTTNRLTLPRDCFPSLHTAIATLMAIYVWRHRRRWSILYIPLAVLIVFATLYLRFHYGLDDIAGASLAVVAAYVAPALQRGMRNGKRANVRKTDVFHRVSPR